MKLYGTSFNYHAENVVVAKFQIPITIKRLFYVYLFCVTLSLQKKYIKRKEKQISTLNRIATCQYLIANTLPSLIMHNYVKVSCKQLYVQRIQYNVI